MNKETNSPEDRKLDALLADQPIEPSDQFLKNTLAAIAETEQESSSAQVHVFPQPKPKKFIPILVTGLSVAAAAVIAIGVFLNPPASSNGDNFTGIDNPDSQIKVNPIASEPSLTDTIDVASDSLSVDELLLLEDDLDDLEFLLEDENLEVLLLLAESFPS